MDVSLNQTARKLEDEFFAKKDAILIAQLRKLEQMERTQKALTEVSGITDETVLKHLVELGVHPDLLATLAMVPLVEVAWADGEVQETERVAILEGAASAGMARGSVDYVLLQQGLAQRPPKKMLDAWIHYIRGLKKALTPGEVTSIKDQFMTRARCEAEAGGGFLGLISKISKAEQAMLDKMAAAFQ